MELTPSALLLLRPSDSDQNYTIGFPGSGLLSLHNHVSQFLLIPFLCRTLTNTLMNFIHYAFLPSDPVSAFLLQTAFPRFFASWLPEWFDQQ